MGPSWLDREYELGKEVLVCVWGQLASLDSFSPSFSFSSCDKGCGIQEREAKEGSPSASL